MKKLIRLLIIEIAVVAVLAVTLVALLLNPPGSEAVDYTFADHSATDIVSVNIENTKGVVTVSTQEGGFLIDGVPSELVDVEAFIEFLTACSEVSALQQVSGGAGDLAKYGLAEPQSVVRVSYSDGSGLLLRVGDQEPLSGNYYCAADGEDGVFLMEAAQAQQFLIVKEQLISFYVTPELAVSSALAAVRDVTFSGGPLESPVTIESVSGGDEQIKQLARTFGAPTHIVRGAGVFELDQSYGLTILSPLCGMSAQSIVYYGLTAEQEDALGFADPYMQVEFDYKNGGDAEHFVLRFLPASEDGSLFFANAKGSGVVYVVERFAFFDISYDKLLLRWFISPLLMDVAGITVESGGAAYDFAVDHTDAKNPVVTLNGQSVDVALFRSLFGLLGSAAHDGEYLGAQDRPDSEAVMRITYHYTEGKADDVMELYAGEGRRVKVFVNGVCEFAMKESFVQRVDQALTAIGQGESFDVNW